MNRDCESCVYAKPYGGENDNRCSAWSCEYINRNEAIDAYKRITKCKDCKHYKTHKFSSGEFMACHDIYGAVRRMDPEDFCSRGWRKDNDTERSEE